MHNIVATNPAITVPIHNAPYNDAEISDSFCSNILSEIYLEIIVLNNDDTKIAIKKAYVNEDVKNKLSNSVTSECLIIT